MGLHFIYHVVQSIYSMTQVLETKISKDSLKDGEHLFICRKLWKSTLNKTFCPDRQSNPCEDGSWCGLWKGHRKAANILGLSPVLLLPHYHVNSGHTLYLMEL